MAIRHFFRKHYLLPVLLAVMGFLISAGGNIAYADGNEVIKKCGGCHKNYLEDWIPTKHGKIFLNNPRNDLEAKACEACHGDGTAHIADAKKKSDEIGAKVDLTLIRSLTKESKLTADEKNEVCLQCHEKQERRILWSNGRHESAGLACVDCHQYRKNVLMVKVRELRPSIPMGDAAAELCVSCHKQIRSQISKQSHHPIEEGKMRCLSCHNPHGTVTEKLLVANSVNELCWQCHAEKRGPFIWEHAPVTESCTACHTPHGSSHDKLLVAKRPYLCQRCHSNSRHPGTLYAMGTTDEASGLNVYNAPANGQYSTSNVSSRIFYRSCSNCHTQIHGSNHPSGKRLFR